MNTFDRNVGENKEKSDFEKGYNPDSVKGGYQPSKSELDPSNPPAKPTPTPLEQGGGEKEKSR